MRVSFNILSLLASALIFVSAQLAAAQDNETADQSQEKPETVVILQSAILTIDPEQLFSQSLFGQRVLEDYRQASLDLAAENRELEAQLNAEELDLTEKRATLSVEEFRPLADAFDEKAQRIRAEQTAKANDTRARPERARQEFLRMAQDVLVEIMRERRALAIFNNDVVFLVADTIDVTEVAIERIDSLIGDGVQ